MNLDRKNLHQPGTQRPILTMPNADPRNAAATLESESVVPPIDTDALMGAAAAPNSFVAFLSGHRASRSLFRVSDAELRNFHVNVRKAVEVLISSPNRLALEEAMRASTDLGKKHSTTQLTLFSLGNYKLDKGPDGKVTDAYFWARDKGIQAYLADHNIPATAAAAKIKKLGGVHMTYATYTAEKKGKTATRENERTGFLQAILKACPEVQEGDHVAIVARVKKSAKFELIQARKLSFQAESSDAAGATDAMMSVTLPDAAGDSAQRFV